MEFKAGKDKNGEMFVMPNFEHKSDGSVVCHLPSVGVISKFKRDNKL